MNYVLDYAERLLKTDSPSGFTARAVDCAAAIAEELGYRTARGNKGGLTIFVPGRDQGAGSVPRRKLCLAAHIDTLGLMVRAIASDGQLLFTRVGGPLLPTLDGEYCTIHTRAGAVYTGTILSLSPAVHVFKDAATRARDTENMAVRIDERVKDADEVRALGIAVGDYICIDPKTTVTSSGFLKSRFIDDKGSCACLLALLRHLKESGTAPRYDLEICFTVYEEVGHGGATLPRDAAELLIVDMGCIGEDLTCTEYQVSICAKDAAGPYDYAMTSRLIELAKTHGIDHAVDVYPFYSSDAAVAWQAGCDLPAALIGPGVHASHGMERTHLDGMVNTIRLIEVYLECE